jgi:hypothetical protein
MAANNSMLPKASEYVITTMSDLAKYARLLSQYYHTTQGQQDVFLFFANELEKTRNKWASGKGRCLSQTDIEILFKFGDLLTSRSIDRYLSHDSIYDKLARFWSHIRKIPDGAAAEVITGRSGSGLPSTPLDFQKIHAAKASSSLMIKTVIDGNNSDRNDAPLLDLPAILLTIIIRSEAHEYVLGKILQRARNATKDLIDTADLLSVTCKEAKMKNGQPVFVTDMRALRDATAHARFIIENDSTGDFMIHFNNTGYGYSFHKTYSRKELLYFYQDYDRITIIYTRLLIIRTLYSYLNIFYHNVEQI